MSDWFLFVILILACYRLTQLLVYDDGPFDMIFKFRAAVGVYDFNAAGEQQTMLGKLFSCPYCVGFWVAAPLATTLATTVIGFFLWWLAIAGGQAFLESQSKSHA